jgi:TPR repeat protein
MEDREIVAQAEAAIEAEDYELAVKLLEPLVLIEHPSAMSTMGLLLQHGLGVPLDVSKAISMFERAAALGNGYAAHNLGTLYAVGGAQGLRDLELSRRWYLKARDLGLVVASDSWYESLREEDKGT